MQFSFLVVMLAPTFATKFLWRVALFSMIQPYEIRARIFELDTWVLYFYFVLHTYFKNCPLLISNYTFNAILLVLGHQHSAILLYCYCPEFYVTILYLINDLYPSTLITRRRITLIMLLT